MKAKRPIIVFDDHCILCNRFVQILIKIDRAGCLALAGSRDPRSKELLESFQIDPELIEVSVLAIDCDGQSYQQSSAIIFALKQLRFPWPQVAAVLALVPRSIRDRIYTAVAKHRFAWFGRSDVCLIADEELKRRIF